MNELDVFLSVGRTANEQQEEFVRAVEERLRREGVIPHTVGRNTFSADAPLKTATQLLDKCRGTVVIATAGDRGKRHSKRRPARARLRLVRAIGENGSNGSNDHRIHSILASWKQKMLESPKDTRRSKALSDLTIAELVGSLKPSQLWSTLGALAAIIGGAFTLGAKLCGS